MSRSQSSRIDRILAVDDSPDNLFLIQTILDDKGYEITLAENGQSALAQIEKNPPDLILLDVMMPGMDGYEVTRRVRANQARLGFIPILLITAHQQSSVVEGLDAGADDFIRKPVDMDELLARVRSLLRLKHSIDEQQQMSRQREDFVSRLTHDLRTPLVAADRMLNLFLQEAFGPVTSEMTEAFEVMIRSNKNLLQMVNTLLEVYRHDAGSKTLTFSPVDLREVVQEVVQELEPLVQAQNLSLQVEVPPVSETSALNTVVLGDRLELRRVLTNLVGNAIKFTDTGSITIRLFGGTSDEVDGDQSPNWLRLEVEDTGSGIPPEDQAGLFERFRQGDHKRAGSGLGLYLSRRIVEAHRGSIRVQSQVGQGSKFTIRLPMYIV
ncbi:hybrid sensor histidine kinase/response regulator [Leptolyngbya sp. NK1-12]|uniref:histidine kinase n=1 Tax=Leptolyngbya sp. NK1-12 TaxID=2547451 RepID=A0AA96WPM2_9CYAN|nr:hybrid sensor histidine kinase/response regulator [Leptolyngbya sp. NK1-12]MBF2046220.1 hybrid sensor histidine kinase/response regulator [Elainella sp. C42_A2020_010]WNZ26231.1 hybrid sensor histidine kinase/response regulator [Leptolyngbya sp. NK1-12]